ncbi:MAG: hypothetical protein AAF206_31815 [Bacteroidota bacterium]
MKLRCVQNSIRLRLRKSELQQLQQEGQVSESIHFPGGQALHFSLKSRSGIADIQAVMEAGELAIILPQQISHTWINSQEVGIEKSLPLPNQQSLHILIEKDFPCTDREDEDKSDTFWELANQKADSC